MLRKKIVLFFVLFAGWSCNSTTDAPDPVLDNFDREAMLLNWADNIIIPGYENYVSKLVKLKEEAASFSFATTEAHLVNLRATWLEAYVAWQYVSMFEIGKAETLTIRNFTNIFPTDAAEIENNISERSYNLALPSKNDEQGFPALDYLLNGIGEDDAAIIAVFKEDPAYNIYMNDVLSRMENLAEQVLADWKGDYKATFMANNASSATSSVDKVINDYLFYYEKYLRAGKIGIPAGVFSSSTLPQNTEAYYHKEAAKVLFMAGLDAVQNFFNGKAFSSSSTGESLQTYLDHLEAKKEDQNLSILINGQFDAARVMANDLDSNFATQVVSDNSKMLQTYDELQKNVVLLKVDMLQALNVQVDFVDADGD